MHKLGASVLALMLLVSIIAYGYLMSAWGSQDDSSHNKYVTASGLIFLILAAYTLCAIVIFVECLYKKKCGMCTGVMLASLLVLLVFVLGSHSMAYRAMINNGQMESILVTLYSMILGNILFISFLCVYCCMCGGRMSMTVSKTIA